MDNNTTTTSIPQTIGRPFESQGRTFNFPYFFIGPLCILLFFVYVSYSKRKRRRELRAAMGNNRRPQQHTQDTVVVEIVSDSDSEEIEVPLVPPPYSAVADPESNPALLDMTDSPYHVPKSSSLHQVQPPSYVESGHMILVPPPSSEPTSMPCSSSSSHLTSSLSTPSSPTSSSSSSSSTSISPTSTSTATYSPSSESSATSQTHLLHSTEYSNIHMPQSSEA